MLKLVKNLNHRLPESVFITQDLLAAMKNIHEKRNIFLFTNGTLVWVFYQK